MFGVADAGKDVNEVLALEEFERERLVVGPVNLGELVVVQDVDDVVAALALEAQGALFGFALALPDDLLPLPFLFAGLARLFLPLFLLGKGAADPSDWGHVADLRFVAILPGCALAPNYFHSSSGGQMLVAPRPAPWRPASSVQSAVASRHLMKWGAWVWALKASSST